MKKCVFIISLLLVLCPSCFGKLWVGYVTTTVNLRSGPSTSYSVITLIPQDGFVFYDDREIRNGFAPVIYIDEDISGYVAVQYIHNYQEVEVDDSGQFQYVGKSGKYNAELHIENNTSVNMTLKLNSSTYEFRPYSKRTISVAPGYVSYTASSKGVIPYVGKDLVESDCIYEWTFYIETVRR